MQLAFLWDRIALIPLYIIYLKAETRHAQCKACLENRKKLVVLPRLSSMDAIGHCLCHRALHHCHSGFPLVFPISPWLVVMSEMRVHPSGIYLLLFSNARLCVTGPLFSQLPLPITHSAATCFSVRSYIGSGKHLKNAGSGKKRMDSGTMGGSSILSQNILGVGVCYSLHLPFQTHSFFTLLPTIFYRTNRWEQCYMGGKSEEFKDVALSLDFKSQSLKAGMEI